MAQTATANLGFQNRFSTTLSSGITASDTTIPLNALPTPTEGFLVIEPDSSTAWEVIYYTSKTGSAVVCTSAANGRGVDDSTAQSHSSGAVVRMDTTAGMFEVLQNGSAMNAGALGGSPFATGWINAVLPSVSSVTNNGNRSYDITFGSTVASYLTPGMRVRTSRTVAAPTQCADLEASSSQYFNDTSVSGMTFTDDFVVSAWIKLESYATMSIASRWNGTSGWDFGIDSSGRLNMAGWNAGGANYSNVTAYQSVPLGKWVHIAAQLDMSAFTATTTTSYIMIDGVDVPAVVARAGTNPTALVQAGNLEIGSRNGGSQYFDGKIAQVAIYSAKVTQANIRATISQGLSGSETSLVSAYSFNNSINDLNANANNLTAQGSAVATNADSPFTVDANGVVGGTYDFGIVTKVATTTATVQVPEGCAIPTSGGVSAVDLSPHKSPFGMPADSGRWRINHPLKTQMATTSNATYGAFQSAGVKITAPVGSWRVGFQATTFAPSSTTVRFNLSSVDLTGSAATVNVEGSGITSGLTSNYDHLLVSNDYTLSSATPYVMYTLGATASGALDATAGKSELFAEFNFL